MKWGDIKKAFEEKGIQDSTDVYWIDVQLDTGDLLIEYIGDGVGISSGF